MTTIKIDVDSAERYLQSENSRSTTTNDGKTHYDILCAFLRNHVRNGAIRLTYKFCTTGQALVDADLIEGARVYATGDPISLPSELNDLLSSQTTHNYDDKAAYPTYMPTLTNNKHAKQMLAELPTKREELTQHYHTTTKQIKTLLNALMMDGTIKEWRRKNKIRDEIGDPQWLTDFAECMSDVTNELARGDRAKVAIAIITKIHKKNKEEHKDPKQTWKSFLLQEVEFKARRAKLKVAGHFARQQEHDGIRVLKEAGDLSAQMSEAASEAIGAKVVVEIKPPHEFDLPDGDFTMPFICELIEIGLTHRLAAEMFTQAKPSVAYAGTGKDPWRACRNGVWSSNAASMDAMTSLCDVISRALENYRDRLDFKPPKSTETRYVQALRQISDTNFQRAALAQAACKLHVANFDALLDMNTRIVAFNDGWLMERRDGAKQPNFRETKPNDYVSKTVGFAHTLCKDAPQRDIDAAKKYVCDLFSDNTKGDYMLDVLAVALWALPIEEFYMLTGEGSNGKTQLMQFLRAAFGDYFAEINHTVLTKPLREGEGPSPYIAALKGARLVNTAEPGENDQIESQQLKRMAGNERLVTRPLYGDPEYIRPIYKLFMSCNDAPDTSASGESVIRRLRKILFDLRFCDDPKKETNERRANNDYDDIWRDRHAPALLWLIATQDLPTTRNIPMPDSVREDSENHVNTALDDLKHFIEEKCEETTHAEEATTILPFRKSAIAHLAGRKRRIGTAAFENAMIQLKFQRSEEKVTLDTGTEKHVRAWKSENEQWLKLRLSEYS